MDNYAFLQERVSLSAGNGWTDARGKVYIFFTLEETMETTSYGHNRATRMFQELENFGLIERRRQGLERLVKIYVKNLRRMFDGKPMTPETGKNPASAPDAAPVMPDTEASAPEVAEMSAYDETASEYRAAPEPEQEPAPERESREPESFRIGKSQRPLEEIQERFAQLEYKHLSYVLDSMKSNRTRVYNPRAYILTALFNASLTCDAYLTARVNCDMAESA